ncbi:KH domain-containing, RNA-binding, signal transduction-associated protein 3-like isoform X2 [Leptidea sinapis]|uniref:KH domain-containing, RNA-binding, signal transduction-associated protein 3-like isoform X2 n=1 Tax=Leptidea sinapis TaxID=189913 RepID=UPI0021410C56|nr:KH domain-containing, RNA-binding, signal transduction-associated protein 3-like isoform X2 [Leptidea sinapis]
MEGSISTSETDEERTPRHPSSTGSTTSSGNGFYAHKNGEWRSERRMLDITRDKPVKVCVRVVVPVRDHPKFNFVGKLLGPKGNSLKRLQEDTMCKMAVLGRGSMKDRQKEEELRMSGDPKFAHLSEELHVEISAFATPAEAHARIAYALAELRRFLVPDYNDDIRQEQMLEMQILSSQTDQRRLTPDSCRTNSEETLQTQDPVHKQRVPVAVNQQPLPTTVPVNHSTPRDFSPPALTPAPEHLPHHQIPSGPPNHSVLVGGGVLQQPAHVLTQNTLLGVVSGGANTRKRPMLGGRNAMSPTKRAVMTLLARARAATHKNAAWPRTQQQSNLLPFIRDDLMASVGVNINLT